MSCIVWLASYPKSGNTWFRIFLANLLANKDKPLSINKLGFAEMIASNRTWIDQQLGAFTSDLTQDEIRLLQPMVYKHAAAQENEIFYSKTHEAFTYNQQGEALHPKEASRCAIYFVRNPLDVSISWAKHNGISLDESIKRLNQPDFLSRSCKQLKNQVMQDLMDWSGHVKSWVDNALVPTLAIRYEDMREKPLETFRRAIQFIGLDYDDEAILKALKFSSFEELQKQECEEGFAEKPSGCKTFFRKAGLNEWREVLSLEQQKSIIDAHGEMMQRFRYIE